MDMNGKIANPTHLVLQHLLVPPITIRPSVAMDASQGRYVNCSDRTHTHRTHRTARHDTHGDRPG
jgi:DNA-directed RNA polymerase beta' subunit